MKNPKVKVWVLTGITTIIIGLALFLAAGTIDYWQGWMYLAINAATGIPLVLLFTKDPILLENRTKLGPAAEQRTAQKVIIALTGIPLIATFVVPALDYRFGWSNMPAWLSLAGGLLLIVSMWMVYRVFKENSFGSATVEVAKDQKVISTGPYTIVRNPMYSCATIYMIGLSLALGSYWGLIASVLVILGFVFRLFDEEKFLAQNLPGYTEYCARVRWHLIPRIF
jgi:protein-S-isoprenylcysteine O-methyltransferase Ste14